MAFNIGKLKSLLKIDLHEQINEQIIGIDIGSTSIKVVQLHSEDGVPTLDTYGELQLGPYADNEIGQTTALEQKRLAEALVDIIRESSVTSNSAVLSISYGASFATTFTVDALDDADIATRVPVEARKYIPISLSEVTLDWFSLARDEKGRRTEIFLVAIHNESLAKVRDVVSGAGLSLLFTELEPFSSARSALTLSKTTAAIIDMGGSATRLYIARDGMIQKTHSFATGGAALTNAIAEAAKIPFAEAEERKRRVGLVDTPDDTSTSTVLRNELSRVFRELDKVVDEYERVSGTPIPVALMLGGGTNLPGLLSFAADMLQREVAFADPFSKVAYPAFLSDTLKTAGPSFTVALGAALRKFES